MTNTFLQLQPDWHELLAAADEDARSSSCWIDVSERRVRLIDDAAADDDGDEGEEATSSFLPVQVDAPPSTHFELELSATMANPQTQRHFVEVASRGDRWVEVLARTSTGDAQQPVRTVFQAPVGAVDVATRQLLAVDVAPDERLVAVGGADGYCALWDAFARAEAFVLRGHVSDVTRVRFFPSAKVLLSASLDFTLRIWSADDGLCAAVLKGHRGGVADTAILGRGRNVLSCSRDGMIHLWSCGTQDVIAKWGNDAQSAVHCLSVLEDAAQTLALSPDDTASAAHSQEAETEGKVLFAGLESGWTLGVDVRVKELVANLRGTAPILSCAAATVDGVPLLLTGGEDGILATWDLRHTSAPLQLQSRSAAPIHSLAVSPGGGTSVWTAQGDGVCCSWRGAVPTVLSGPVFDPVRGLAVAPRTGRVFTVGRDGLLRDYIPHVAR